MRISVVVLSYNRPALLADALASIARQAYQPHEVIVVDNPSDASAEIAHVVSNSPNVRLLALPLNIGFAGGMNAGLTVATADHVFLTEDDLVLDAHCLGALAAAMRTRSAPAVLAPVMYNRAAGTVRCAGGRLSLRSVYGLDVHTTLPPQDDLSFVPGAALFAPKTLWDDVGGFREDFFMYLEDCELCLRLRRHGVPIAVVSDARVDHFEPPDALTPDHIEFHKHKNLLALYVLHARWPWVFAFAFRYLWRAWAEPGERRVRLAAIRSTASRLGGLVRDRRDLNLTGAGIA